MSREVDAVKVLLITFLDQDLEGGSQAVHLDFAPQLALLTSHAVQDVASDVAKVLRQLMRDCRFVAEQLRLVEVRLEGPGRGSRGRARERREGLPATHPA